MEMVREREKCCLIYFNNQLAASLDIGVELTLFDFVLALGCVLIESQRQCCKFEKCLNSASNS